MILTGYGKYEPNEEIQSVISEELKELNNYTKWIQMPSALKGIDNYYLQHVHITIAEFEWKNELRFVRIYFDTPILERINKDRAAKFVDMLSAIGGTMGLLTGFSIISAVEILYFLVKFALKRIGKIKI